MFTYLYNRESHSDTSAAYMNALGIDEETQESILAQAQHEQTLKKPKYNFDIVNAIKIKQSDYDITNPFHEKREYTLEDGTVVAEYFDTHYHVNVGAGVPELAQYKLDPQPTTPSRVYQGGVMPVCYAFDSEAEFDSVNPFKQESEELI